VKKYFVVLMTLSILVFSSTVFSAPVVSNTYVTDVTTRSFSVIWTSDEAITSASIEIFTDAAGTTPASFTLNPYPTQCNADLATTAMGLGIAKVQVTGLTSDAVYYFRTVTTSATGTTTVPPSGDLPVVQTEVRTVRATAGGVPFSNDVMLSDWTMADGTTPADGTLLFASCTRCDYPVTAFVGDCVSVPGSALIDLNNVFARDSGESMDLTQGINMNFVAFRGLDGTKQTAYKVPVDNMLAEVHPPDPGLVAGWNMFSTPLEPTNSAIRTVLASIIPDTGDGSLLSVWDYVEPFGPYTRFDPNVARNTLSSLHGNTGYWFELLSDTSLAVDGTESVGPTTLYGGWNLVGSGLLEWMTPQDFVNRINGPVISIWAINEATGSFVTYRVGSPRNTLSVIEPGKAYWLEMDPSCGTTASACEM